MQDLMEMDEVFKLTMLKILSKNLSTQAYKFYLQGGEEKFGELLESFGSSGDIEALLEGIEELYLQEASQKRQAKLGRLPRIVGPFKGQNSCKDIPKQPIDTTQEKGSQKDLQARIVEMKTWVPESYWDKLESVD